MQKQATGSWVSWVVQPLTTLTSKYRDLVRGPIDDLVDEVFRDLAPTLVKKIGEQEIEEDVEEFLSGAIEGRFEARLNMYPEPEFNQSDDYYAGYDWGFENASTWKGDELPSAVKRRVVKEQIQEFRGEVTEQMVIATLEKAWATINPREIFMTVIRAVKQHGWKIGLVYALGELVENFVLPAALTSLTGVPIPPGGLAWLPLNDLLFAAIVKRLGRAGAVEFDPDGHLDWYENQFGAVRLASVSRVVDRFKERHGPN